MSYRDGYARYVATLPHEPMGIPARVVPDCDRPQWHDPEGPVPAAYWYEYREPVSGLAGLCMVLCVPCCARMRLESGRPGADQGRFPEATRIWPVQDANTLERVI